MSAPVIIHRENTVPPLTIDLPSLFKRHRRVHVAFSGGKDSIVCCDWWPARMDQALKPHGYVFAGKEGGSHSWLAAKRFH